MLNDEAGVSDATRAQIQLIIEQQGYVPNRHARAFAKSQSFLVGFAYNNRNPGYVLELLQGVQSIAIPAGYEVVVHSVPSNETDTAEDLIRFMRRSACDALLITPPLSESAKLIAVLEDQPWPVVRIAGDDILTGLMQVSYDDRAAAREITHFIIDKGHVDIGFLGGLEAAGPTRRRFAGFRDALDLKGLKLNESYLRFGDFTFLSGLQAGEDLLEMDYPPTAVFCANDEMAAGLMHAVRNIGQRVPANLSVVGFDDTALASQVWPPLTTVKQPVFEMAAKATELLLGLSEPSPSQLPEQFKHQLIVRQSLADK